MMVAAGERTQDEMEDGVKDCTPSLPPKGPQAASGRGCGCRGKMDGDARDKPATASISHVCFREDSFAYAGTLWRGWAAMAWHASKRKSK